MGDSVAYSDIPKGFEVKSSPSYGDVPEGFSVKSDKTPVVPDESFLGIMGRRASDAWNSRPDRPAVPKNNAEFMQQAKEALPGAMKAIGSGFGVVASPLGAAGENLEYRAAKNAGISDEKAVPIAKDTGDVSEALLGIVPGAKKVPKLTGDIVGGAGGVGGRVLGATREAINAKSDAMATNVPVTKETAATIKTLKKAGHSDEEIVEGMKRAKEQGLTPGEAFNNPDLLGLERKVSGMNNPGGKMVRDNVKNRVDPTNNVSMPFKLKSIADPLVKEVDKASKEIGTIVNSAPKTPINMNSVKTSLLSEKRPPGSMVTNTLGRIDKLVEWAGEQGNSFEAWHRVKQEIWNLKNEAKDANAVEKLDAKTANDYYKKINEVLGGKSPGLPQDLAQTGSKYGAANKVFGQNLSGRTISDVLSKMPTGGTPASALKYLYKQLAGSKELQEELFEGMPESQRAGMMKFLEAVKDAGRSGASDVVKSMQDGSPSFPITTRQVLHKAYDRIADFITRKDYDAIGREIVSPEVEQIAKKLGYVKPLPPEKPILRLTYKPEKPDIFVGNDTQAIIGNEKTTAAAKAIRDRMEKLGYGPGVLRAQDLNVIRDMETKYGQSELGRFMIEHKNEPIMGRMWDVPQTEYSQATVDKMMGKDAMSRLSKLDKTMQDSINFETRTAWESHKFPLADMVMARRQALKELSKAKGEPVQRNPFGKNPLDMSFDDMLNNQ